MKRSSFNSRIPLAFNAPEGNAHPSCLSSQSKAKDMVALAERIRMRLAGPSGGPGGGADEGEGSRQEMQDLLLSVGIASPVTRENAGALYHQQLSRQVREKEPQVRGSCRSRHLFAHTAATCQVLRQKTIESGKASEVWPELAEAETRFFAQLQIVGQPGTNTSTQCFARPPLQLSDFVGPLLAKSNGMMALVDVYCFFNRARGTGTLFPLPLLVSKALAVPSLMKCLGLVVISNVVVVIVTSLWRNSFSAGWYWLSIRVEMPNVQCHPAASRLKARLVTP